jgi:urease accessory protein
MTARTHARRRPLAGVALTGLAVALAAPSAASAHDQGLDLTASFGQGFLHPVTGPDHLVAMVAVGLLSGVLGGRAVLTIPALFVSYLLLGGVAGFLGLELVGAEWLILASLLGLGAVLAGGVRPDRRVVIGAVALFGFAHGNAHGLELPFAASPAGYAGGFVLASATCHLAGVLLAHVATRPRFAMAPVRALGMATLGTAIVLGSAAVTG